MNRPPPAGFTLIEVVVALFVVGVVVLLTHQLFAVVLHGAQAIESSRLALDREANARRWLAGAWSSLEVGGGTGGFEGHREHVEFATWTMTPGGWFAPGRVRIGVRCGQLVAASTANTMILAEAVDSVAFDYLLTPGERSQWVADWVSPSSAPLAVRVRIRRKDCRQQCVDTLLFSIGSIG